MAALPQELADMVVDHLHIDTVALQALSLVSRSWRVPAQRFLFVSIALRDGDISTRVELFRHFLSGSPWIAAYIEELELSGPNAQIAMNALDMDLLWNLLQVLPRLRSLAIVLLNVRAGVRADAYTPFPLEQLTLRWLQVANLRAFLQLFSPIGALHITQIHGQHTHTSEAPIRPWLSLRELTLSSAFRGTLVSLVPALASCATLRFWLYPGVCAVLNDALGRVGASVVSLEIELLRYDVAADAGLDLAPCTALRRVLFYAGTWASESWPELFRVLDTLPPSVRVLDIEFADRSHANAFDPRQLVPYLEKPSTQLESLVFSCTLSRYTIQREVDSFTKARIRDALPALERRGILKWDSGPRSFSPMQQYHWTSKQLRSEFKSVSIRASSVLNRFVRREAYAKRRAMVASDVALLAGGAAERFQFNKSSPRGDSVVDDVTYGATATDRRLGHGKPTLRSHCSGRVSCSPLNKLTV